MDPASEIADVERRWQEAVRDRDLPVLEALLGPEFTLTTGRPGAPVRTREEYLRITATDYVIRDFAFEALEVLALGADAAVVRSRYRQTGSMAGEDRSQTFVMTDVFGRRAGRWVAITRHASALAPGD
jgi:ketosteroid isomerase-like protein